MNVQFDTISFERLGHASVRIETDAHAFADELEADGITVELF